MPAPVDLTGLLFGRLTARTLDKETTSRTGKRHWHCDCACGRKATVWSVYLRSGHTTSCGCARSEAPRKVGRASRERAAAAAREARKGQTQKGPGGTYIPASETRRRLRVSRHRLLVWSKGCDHLGGRPLRTLRVPGGAGLETWYHKEDVEQIEKARSGYKPRRDRGEGRYTFEDGEYLTLALFKREHRANTERLYFLADSGVMAARPHPDDRREGRGGRRPRVYREKDWLAAEQKRRQGFDGEFPDPEGPRWNLTRAAREGDLPRGFLQGQIIRSKYFEAGRLPSKLMRPPAECGRRIPEHTVLPADVERLKKAVRAALEQGDLCDWPEAGEIPGRWRLTAEQGTFLPAFSKSGGRRGSCPHVGSSGS
jgi:hypothetical protein